MKNSVYQAKSGDGHKGHAHTLLHTHDAMRNDSFEPINFYFFMPSPTNGSVVMIMLFFTMLRVLVIMFFLIVLGVLMGM